MQYTYLLINLFTVSFPLARSFEGRVRFVRRWPALLAGIGVAGAVFVVWDIWFTQIGVWQFNAEYITGLHISVLPLEEWLFFLTVPFACMFIHDCLVYFFPRPNLGKWVPVLGIGLAVLLAVVGLLYFNRQYTSVTFLATSVWLVVFMLALPRAAQYRFWLAFAVCLLPFFTVNGLLTSLPVLIYNDAQNLGIRLGTIPLEDAAYGMLLLQITYVIYVRLGQRLGYVWPTKLDAQ